MRHTLHIGNNLGVLPTLPDNSVDAIVTDPPYGLEFMGKEWDAPWKAKPSKEFNEIKDGTLGGFTKLPNHSRVNNLKCENCGKWKFSSNPCSCDNPKFPEARLEAMVGFQEWYYSVAVEMYRVLKPGGHILSFGGSRTYHRMACAIEDAGFEVRDQLMWVYGSGFPKSHNISKAMDKANGVEREDKFEGAFDRFAGPTGNKKCDKCGKWLVSGSPCQCPRPQDEAKSHEAKQWEGWGTALKPAHEPIVLARKPLEGTVVANVLKHGTGAINIDACRVEHNEDLSVERLPKQMDTNGQGWGFKSVSRGNQGRWPANLIHDGSQEVLDLFPESNGGAAPQKSNIETGRHYDGGWGPVQNEERREFGSGSAARFFYCPKANKKDRDEGCEELNGISYSMSGNDSTKKGDIGLNKKVSRKNHHPTVKPTELMRYLCRLITPPGGTVLDPFTGSGSTGKAAILEGFNFIGIELSPEYAAIAEARIRAAYNPDEA